MFGFKILHGFHRSFRKNHAFASDICTELNLSALGEGKFAEGIFVASAYAEPTA